MTRSIRISDNIGRQKPLSHQNFHLKFSFALAALLMVAGGWTARGADAPQASIAHWMESLGGQVVRGPDGAIVEISLARTGATNNDIERVVEIKGLKRLDLSFTYVSDPGIELLQQLQQLEELTLDTTESITDAAVSYLRANKHLRKLVLRGTDITDVGMPYLAELTDLRSLDLSYTMVGDVGFESLPALSQLEELNLGGTRITGINLNFLKLLPKLKKLSFNGIQRRNAGACWTPLITDLDLDTISLLSGLEDLNLGVGVSLGRTGVAVGAGNCRVTGGIQLTDLGLAKLAKLTKLKRLDVSGAKITPAGLSVLKNLPQLQRLSLWNCKALDDSAAPELVAIARLTDLDLSYTSAGDATLKSLAALPSLKLLYLTDTKVTPAAVEAFRKQKPASFVSWARRPEPIAKPPKVKTKPKASDAGEPLEP
jgi:internalin A